MKKLLKKVTSITLIIATLLALCSCTAGGKTKVDIKEYIEIEYSGMNGHATATLKVDYDGLNELVAENLKELVSKNNEKYSEFVLYELSNIKSYIDIDLKEKYSNLSNGDTVTVTVSAQEETLKLLGWDFKDVEKELGIKIVDTEIDIKVEGLQDGIFLDLFDGIEKYISYTNAIGDDWVVDGEAQATISFPDDYEKKLGDVYLVRAGWHDRELNIVYNNECIAKITYSVDDSSTLSSGDEFVIKINTTSKSKLEELNYVYESSKTFVVPKLNTRVTSVDQLSTAEIEQIKKDIATQCNEDNYNVLEVKYVYFCTRKPSSAIKYEGCILAAVNVEDGLFGSSGVYVWVDVVRTPEGKVVINNFDYERAYEGVEEKTNNHPNYTFEAI